VEEGNMNVAQVILLVAFAGFSVLNLVAVGLKKRTIQYFSTPIRVPVLAVFYILASPAPSWLVIAALAAAFVGDVLWFLQGNESFMMLMSAAYLLAFVFYALALLQPFAELRAVPAWHYLLALVYAAYFVLIFSLLKSSMGEMKVPMAVYFAIVLAMAFAALTRMWWRQGVALWLPLAGSLSFLASETVHGFHLFKHGGHSKRGELVGDLFYALGHALIVLGFVFA
jgi:uncharacterized membrane protein YhhN